MTKCGYSFGLVGAPKSGKSHACLSLAKLPGTKFAFVAPLGELQMYRGTGITAEPYMDEGWRPSEKKFGTDAYARMMAKLKELAGVKDLSAVIFDTMNRGPSEIIWHYVMSGYNTDDPRTLGGNSRQPYVTYASRLTELLEQLDLLRYKTGAHIVMTFHEDVRESEGTGTPRKELEGTKTVLRWDVARLPMLRGGMRQDIMGWPDAAFYCEPALQSNPFRCKLVCLPDSMRAAGTRLRIMGKLQAMKEIPNDLLALIKLADESVLASAPAAS
jgi:hypothetical protein